MWPAIIGAAAGSMKYPDPAEKLGSYFDSQTFGRWAAADQNWENAKAQEKQNEWIRNMADSAHQREVRDLRAAGLNPILSAGGSGAPSPQGAQPAQMLGAPAPHFPANMQVSNLAEVIQNQQRIDIDRAKTAADIEKIAAEIPNVSSKKRLAEAQTMLTHTNVKQKDYERPGLLRTGVEWLKKVAPEPKKPQPVETRSPWTRWMYAHPKWK